MIEVEDTMEAYLRFGGSHGPVLRHHGPARTPGAGGAGVRERRPAHGGTPEEVSSPGRTAPRSTSAWPPAQGPGHREATAGGQPQPVHQEFTRLPAGGRPFPNDIPGVPQDTVEADAPPSTTPPGQVTPRDGSRAWQSVTGLDMTRTALKGAGWPSRWQQPRLSLGETSKSF